MDIRNRFFPYLLGALVIFIGSPVWAETVYQNAVHQLVINKNKVGSYTHLAKSIGFEFNKKYTYTEYADIKQKNNIGTAGNYDYLLLSTGGSEWDNNAWQKYIKQQCGWETTFYKNHNLTVIHDVCQYNDRVHSWVRILKVAKGRQPDLYKE